MSTADHVLALLHRLEVSVGRRCCPACGCLLLPAEPCPNQAQHSTTRK